MPVTKLGNYGNNAVPSPIEYTDEMYEATTVSFTAASGDDAAYLSDSANQFREKHFTEGMTIKVETTSGTNDGNFTIADRGVSRSTILLSSSDSLTTETAATAGTVTISRIIYEPHISTGCPYCGSLSSR